MQSNDTERPFLTVSELCAYLGVTRNTAYRLIAIGEVPAIRVGGSIRIPRDTLERQLAERAGTPAA